MVHEIVERAERVLQYAFTLAPIYSVVAMNPLHGFTEHAGFFEG